MHIHGCKQTPATPPTTSDEESSGSTNDDEMKKKKGNRAMRKKKFPKAIKYYTKAVKIDPENPTYRLNRAIANSALELWKDAEEDAARAVDLGQPASAKSHFQLARARLRRGRLEEAAEAVRLGLEACPGERALEDLSREVSRAVAAREARRRKEAEAEEARRGLAASPTGAKSQLEAARAAFVAGRVDDCVRLCEEARCAAAAAVARAGAGTPAAEEHLRDDIAVCSLLGKATMRQRRWDEAVAAFQNAVDLQEAHYSMEKAEEREALSNAYNNLGIALKNVGRLESAIEALNHAYMKATNGDDKVATAQSAQILQNVAQCLVQQGKMDDARMMYSRALEIGQRLYRSDHASHALNYMGIARCLKREGKIPEAMKSYATACQILDGKDIEECLAEIPEVPSKERLEQVRQQCRQELAQLVMFMEELKRRQAAGELGEAGEAGGLEAPAEGAA